MYQINYGTKEAPVWRGVQMLVPWSKYLVYKVDDNGTKWCRLKQTPPYPLHSIWR